MPIPVIPVVAGGALAALVWAGSKEGKPAAAPSSDGGSASAAPGTSATPTQAATGGDNGGAQYPSHADVSAPTGEVNLNVGNHGTTGSGFLTAPPPPDPWAPSAGPSLNVEATKAYVEPTTGTTGALGAVVGIGGMTTKAIGDAFGTWGEHFGAIW
jgi:hypothetical protein